MDNLSQQGGNDRPLIEIFDGDKQGLSLVYQIQDSIGRTDRRIPWSRPVPFSKLRRASDTFPQSHPIRQLAEAEPKLVWGQHSSRGYRPIYPERTTRISGLVTTALLFRLKGKTIHPSSEVTPQPMGNFLLLYSDPYIGTIPELDTLLLNLPASVSGGNTGRIAGDVASRIASSFLLCCSVMFFQSFDFHGSWVMANWGGGLATARLSFSSLSKVLGGKYG